MSVTLSVTARGEISASSHLGAQPVWHAARSPQQQCCVGWRVRFAHGCAAAENKIPRFADGSLDSDACCGQCRCWLPIDLVVYKRKRRQQRQRSQVGCGSRTRTVFRADLCSTRRPCHARAEDLAVTCMVSAGDDLCFAEVAWFDCRPNRPPRAFF